MDTKEFYEDRSTHYRINAQRKANILALIPVQAEQILDIGCGAGILAKAIKEIKPYSKIFGADISSPAIEKASRFLDGSFIFNLEQENWPSGLSNAEFDLVIASEVIEHLFDSRQFLENLKKTIKPGGKIILTLPNLLFWKNRMKIFLGRFEYENRGIMDYGHIRFFSYTSSKKLFSDAGLIVEKEKHFYPNLYSKNLNFLGGFFPGFFAYQMIFRLSKAL